MIKLVSFYDKCWPFLFLWWFSVLQLSIFIKACRVSALGAPQTCSLLWNRRKFFLRKNIPPKIISISQKKIFSLLWGRFQAVVQRDKLSIRIFSNERALCCNAHLSFEKHPKNPHWSICTNLWLPLTLHCQEDPEAQKGMDCFVPISWKMKVSVTKASSSSIPIW